MKEYITKYECWHCGGKGQIEEIKGTFKKHKKIRKCYGCYGTKQITAFVCQNCELEEIESSYDIHTGQCKYCYADMKTGKYIDIFFYINQDCLPQLSKKVQELMKEGYFPLGRPVQFGQCGGVSQAVIKKDILKHLKKM